MPCCGTSIVVLITPVPKKSRNTWTVSVPSVADAAAVPAVAPPRVPEIG
jgi:hypothetical protein